MDKTNKTTGSVLVAIFLAASLVTPVVAEKLTITGTGGAVPDDDPAGVTFEVEVTDPRFISSSGHNVTLTLENYQHNSVGDLIVRLEKVGAGDEKVVFDQIALGDVSPIGEDFDGDYGFNSGMPMSVKDAALTRTNPIPSGAYMTTAPDDVTNTHMSSAWNGLAVAGVWRLFVSDNSEWITTNEDWTWRLDIEVEPISPSVNPIEPPTAPVQYENGPTSPQVATTNLSDPEKAAYALYEAVILVTKVKIHATSCSSTMGSYPVTIFANGLVHGDLAEDNKVTVTSPGGGYTLDADLNPSVLSRGQRIDIAQLRAGVFDGRVVTGTRAVAIYNEARNMLVMQGSANVVGASGRPDNYHGSLIKDFYRGALDSADPEYFLIYDWGLEALNKLGYPTNKYWQRSKSRRDNGQIAKTVFVQDRLVGATACRISIATEGFNDEDIFWQGGILTVETKTPAQDVPEFDFSMW